MITRLTLGICTYLAYITSSFAAAVLANAGVNLSTKSVAAGGSMIVYSSVYAPSVAVNKATITYSYYAVSSTNVVAANPSLTYVYVGQNFDKGEYKAYQVPFNIPKTFVTGRYLLKIFGTNADKTVRYFSMEGLSDKVTLTVTGGTTTPTPTPTPSPSPSPSPTITYLRGVNLLDLANRGATVPGTYGSTYVKPTLAGLQALKARGIGTIRLSFMWERLQRSLGGPLDTAYLGYIIDTLKDSKTAGLQVILDMHSYGRYYTPSNGLWLRFGDVNGPTQANFNQVWRDLVKAIQAQPNAYAAVYGFDLMNEPFDLPSINGMTPQRLWEVYAQGAVDAIRSTGEKKTIFVGGYFYSSAELFSSYHPVPFITDPANNIIYEGHSYADSDNSGTYTRTFAAETELAIGKGFASVSARTIARVKALADWGAKHKQRVFLGEFGWPNSEYVGGSDADKWNQVAEDVYKFMDSVNMSAATWVVCSQFRPGDSNILNSYYMPGMAAAGIVPLSNAGVIERHPGK